MTDIVYRLRERASVARCENTGTALGDAVHFEEAADEITRLRAALEAASPWKQMDSAPKDGTPVLMVFLYDDGEVLLRVVWWEGVRTWPWRDESTGYREQNAVAWMPLPAPPAMGGGDE